MLFFDTWLRLRNAGILGLNARNRDYIMRHNPRRRYPLVDDKLTTKRLAIEAGIAVPQLYATFETEHDLQKLGERLAPYSEFVIKPAHGSGGSGVLVIDGRRKDLVVKPDGRGLSLEEVEFHVSNILSGVYSLGGVRDDAMVEYRVRVDPIFDPVSYQGVPDIRLLVYRGVPTMAMVRLPTRQSDGKANLHQGAVGVGIEIATGLTVHGVWQNRIVAEHPDFGVSLSHIEIPNWPRLLELGARCYELTGLGYLGVDIVIDRTHGPLLLELNARPGLAIQIANRRGLRGRLEAIDRLESIPGTAVERCELARELFRIH
ncbi:MAG TPA: alpha-L-glutamate ligase-like protein [Gammaproteobacteria bacterium]|nr:alpha-L-glutamate ligase-like protein [Gammaproteobacteria bacterium]